MRALPCVLAVGGLDPGGGAGLLADARAVLRAGAFPCAAAAVLTVQSTAGLRAVRATPKAEVIAECTEVLRHQRVRAFKLGALGTAENVRAIADLLALYAEIPAVVDPVIAPTRGRARLLDERAVRITRERLVPRATLLTVNAAEAEALAGTRVTRVDEAHDAAARLVALGAAAVLVKGGHLTGALAVDVLVFADGRAVEVRSPRLALAPVHGGGCVLAALVAGRIAAAADDYRAAPARVLLGAVRWAKKVHYEALSSTADVGGAMRVLVP